METIKNNPTRNQLLRDWITYAVTCSFLAVVNWLTTPGYWWVVWVLAGWGIGLLLRTTFRLTGLYDDNNQ